MKYKWTVFYQMIVLAGADPGFPVAGGANPPGGAPTYDFAKFREKLHDIEKILGRGGGCMPGAPPPNPPLVRIGTITSEISFGCQPSPRTLGLV